MKCMVVDGKMTVKKYREWKGKLAKGVLVTAEDEAGDLVPMSDSDGDSDDDYDGDHEEFERLMQQDYPENGSYSDSEDECGGESGAAGAAGAVGGSGSEGGQEQRLNSAKRRRKSS